MSDKLTNLKDEFLMLLYKISKIKMVGYIAGFIQGEDALLLRLVLNKAMTPKELSENLKITKGRVTAIINILKKKGHIVTKTNEEDKRSIIVELSNSGEKYFMEKLGVADAYFTNLFDLLGFEDAKSLVFELQKLINKVEEENL